MGTEYLIGFVEFALILHLSVIAHELGHYWAARFFGVRVEIVSIGYGRRVWGFRIGVTDFRISATPLGGYVKMRGEQPGDENSLDPRSFLAKPRWQRLVISFAAPLMNFLLAYGALASLYLVKYPALPDPIKHGEVGEIIPNSPVANSGIRTGDRIVLLENISNPSWEDIVILESKGNLRPFRVVVERNGREFEFQLNPLTSAGSDLGPIGWKERSEILVVGVDRGTPAKDANLRPGDVLIAANGEPIQSLSTLQHIVRSSRGEPIEIAFLRQGQQNKARIRAIFDKERGEGQWVLGVEMGYRSIDTRLSPKEALAAAAQRMTWYLKTTGLALRSTINGSRDPGFRGKSLMREFSSLPLSLSALFEMLAFLSFNLAVFNLLPIPPCDGNAVMFLVIEILLRRDLTASAKRTYQKTVFLAVLTLMLAMIARDLWSMAKNSQPKDVRPFFALSHIHWMIG